MRHFRMLLGAVALAAALGIVGWVLVGWIIRGAFESATQKGGLQELLGGVEASVGSTLARGDIPMQPGKTAGEGALAFYQRNPQALQRDKKYFETWSAALAIARESIRSRHESGGWESSTAVAWIPASHRTDSWGHAFCVQSAQHQAIVLSPGPQALGSLECSTVRLSEDELAKVPRGRLTPGASGALILVVNHK